VRVRAPGRGERPGVDIDLIGSDDDGCYLRVGGRLRGNDRWRDGEQTGYDEDGRFHRMLLTRSHTARSGHHGRCGDVLPSDLIGCIPDAERSYFCEMRHS